MRKKRNDTPMTEVDAKRIRRNAYIKMAAMVGIVAAAMAFGSIAWFTQNREVEGSGVQMRTTKHPFQIESIAVDNNNIAGRKGAFYQGVHSQLNVPEDQIWLMLKDENFGNFENDSEGIGPGSEGMISFNFTPLEAPLSVNYTFQITGYQAVDGAAPVPITANDRENEDLVNYLSGHLLLFRDRIETETGDYIYKGFIGTGEKMERVLKNVSYTGVNQTRPVTFYWIWPETLSCLGEFNSLEGIEAICDKTVLYDSDGNVTTNTAIGKTTYQRVVAHIEQHPQYYMKGVTGTVRERDIAADYSVYGDKYDQADNRIGAAVDYVVLKMTVTAS